MAREVVLKVGAEVEGLWKTLPPNAKLVHDVSVNNLVDEHVGLTGKNWSVEFPHVGELVSPPFTKLGALAGWLRVNWPQKILPPGPRYSLGFHLHFSFKKKYLTQEKSLFGGSLEVDPLSVDLYGLFATRRFMLDWQEWALSLGKELDLGQEYEGRIRGGNRFAVPLSIPEAQMGLANKGETRRTLWNFCKAMHGTLECRAYPVFPTAEIAVEVVKRQVMFLENWAKLEIERPLVLEVKK